MKTKFIVMAAIAAVLGMSFTACSSNDDDFAGKTGASRTRSAVKFSVTNDKTPGTRAAEASVATVEDNGFSVWAFDGTSAYMGSATAGISVSGSNAVGWTYDPVQYWPTNGNLLKFMAVTPASYVTSNSGTYAATSASVTATQIVIPDYNAQEDLMFAKNDGTGTGINLLDQDETTAAGQVALTFKHALSQIVFKGYLDDNDAISKAIVADIDIVNVNSKGDIVFTQAGAFSTANLSVPATYNTGLVATPEITTKVAGEAIDLTAVNGALMVLPQEITGWDAGSDPRNLDNVDASGVPNDDGTYLRIKAQILNNNGVELVSNADYHYVPVGDITWEPGKKYTYTIKFTANSLTPIVFGTVSVGDWTGATGTPNPVEF